MLLGLIQIILSGKGFGAAAGLLLLCLFLSLKATLSSSVLNILKMEVVTVIFILAMPTVQLHNFMETKSSYIQ